MSAPSTNIERETRRHAPSLLGIGLAILLGLVMGSAITYTAMERADAPEAAATQTVN